MGWGSEFQKVRRKLILIIGCKSLKELFSTYSLFEIHISLFYYLLLQASYRVPTGPENPRILFQHFPGSFSPGKRLQVLESPGNLLTVTQ